MQTGVVLGGNSYSFKLHLYLSGSLVQELNAALTVFVFLTINIASLSREIDYLDLRTKRLCLAFIDWTAEFHVFEKHSQFYLTNADFEREYINDVGADSY